MNKLLRADMVILGDKKKIPGGRWWPLSGNIPVWAAIFFLQTVFLFGLVPGLGAELGINTPLPSLVVKGVRQAGVATPEWKKNWDQARDFFQQGDYEKAVTNYELTLAAKGDLEQPRWELARILLAMQSWEKATLSLELLIEQHPSRIDYLNALAQVMRERGFFARAIDLYGKARLLAPENLAALKGLAQSLVAVGRKEEALALFIELYDRSPENFANRKDLANLAFELGQYELARQHMVFLANQKNAEMDISLMTARVHDKLNLTKLSAKYWQKVIAKDPGNREAHGRLALTYEEQGNYDKAIAHLKVLLEKNPQNASLLNRIIRIYVTTDRFAEALPYFEQYVAQRPDDKEALLSIININTALGNDAIPIYRRLLAITPDDPAKINTLANDLLAIGEVEGALFMWEHIARLVPDRPEVYRPLAELLLRLNRRDRLLEVLEKLHALDPGDTKVILQLAFEYINRHEYKKAREYAAKLEAAPDCDANCLMMRASVNEGLGMAEQALPNYEALLAERPDRLDLRLKCINLAARLGLLEVVIDHVEQVGPEPEGALETRFMIARALDEAGAYTASRREYQTLLSELPGKAGIDAQKNELIRRIRYDMADLMVREGLVYEAEEILRTSLVSTEEPLALKKLFDLAVRFGDDNGKAAGIWLDRLTRKLGGNDFTVIEEKARLLGKIGSYRSAIRILRRQIGELAGRIKLAEAKDPNNPPADLHEALWRTRVILGTLYLDSERYGSAEKIFLELLEEKTDFEVLVLLHKTYKESDQQAKEVNLFREVMARCEGDECHLLLGALYDQYGLADEMLAIVAASFKKTPGSTKFADLYAKGLAAEGRFLDAAAVLDKQIEVFPENVGIHATLANLYFRAGQFDKALAHCEAVLSRDPSRYDVLLLKLRCFIALSNTTGARELYQAFFTQPVQKTLEMKCREQGVNIPVSPASRSFWDILTFSDGQQQNEVDMVMSASFVADNETSDKKKINEIAAPLFSRYRWEKEFRKFKDNIRWTM